MPFPIAAAVTAGGALLGQGIQSAGSAARNRKQYHIQKKLMDYSQEKNKAMALFNQEQQMQMWRDTGPQGQMEQLKLAGLNPGLIYGMGGAGGQTAQAAQAQGQSTPQANVENIAAGMGITGGIVGEQIALIQAQKDKLKAETSNILSQIPAHQEEPANIRADTALKIANTGNTQADTELKKIETKIAELNRQYQEGTLEQKIANVYNEASTIMANARSAMAQADIDDATKETKIKLVETELIAAALRNTLTIAHTDKANAEINKMATDVQQGWQQLAQQATKLKMDKGHLAIEVYNKAIEAYFPDKKSLLEHERGFRNKIKDLFELLQRQQPR